MAIIVVQEIPHFQGGIVDVADIILIATFDLVNALVKQNFF